MSIGKSMKIHQAKETIKNVLAKRPLNDYTRNDLGKVLDDLGRWYGYDAPNQLIKEFQLDEKLNLQPYCPVATKLDPKKD